MSGCEKKTGRSFVYEVVLMVVAESPVLLDWEPYFKAAEVEIGDAQPN